MILVWFWFSSSLHNLAATVRELLNRHTRQDCGPLPADRDHRSCVNPPSAQAATPLPQSDSYSPPDAIGCAKVASRGARSASRACRKGLEQDGIGHIAGPACGAYSPCGCRGARTDDGDGKPDQQRRSPAAAGQEGRSPRWGHKHMGQTLREDPRRGHVQGRQGGDEVRQFLPDAIRAGRRDHRRDSQRCNAQVRCRGESVFRSDSATGHAPPRGRARRPLPRWPVGASAEKREGRREQAQGHRARTTRCA